MCGLSGIAGNIEPPDRNTFHDLLRISQIRGDDGTGMAVVQRDRPDEIDLLKVAGDPSNLISIPDYHRLMFQKNRLLLGHNRSKTVGSSSAEQAHPFQFGHIVGAHNGTLDYQSHWDLDKHANWDSTDSQAIFKSIADVGIDDTIKLMAGAWALVWYDTGKHTLNMLRNKERPLYYAYDQSRTTLYWASEPNILYLAMGRNGIQYAGKSVIGLETDMLTVWGIPDNPNEVFKKPIQRALAAPKRKYAPNKNWFKSDGWVPASYSADSLNSAKKDDPKITVFKPDKNKHKPAKELVRLSYPSKHGQVNPFYPGYSQGEFIFRKEFEELMAQGCVMCSTSPQWGAPVKFLKDRQFLCKFCVEENKDDVLTIMREFL